MNWYLMALKKGLTFRGRSRRKEFWYFVLISLLVSIALSFIDGMLGWYDLQAGIGILSGIYSLLIILPNIALSVRRLHDTNRSGWWILLVLIPIIGFLVLLYFCVKNGTSGQNDFGYDPKEWQYGAKNF